MKSIGVPFEFAIVASEIGSYKPAHGHWQAFWERSGADQGRQLHVAASDFHDIGPANELGVRSIWINRLGERGRARPDREQPDLTRPGGHARRAASRSGNETFTGLSPAGYRGSRRRADTLPMSYVETAFMGSVTCYLLGRVFAGTEAPLEVIVYAATAAFGLDFLVTSWRSLWVGAGALNSGPCTRAAQTLLKASPRMFESELLDRLSRVHPVVPLVIFIPAIAVLFALGPGGQAAARGHRPARGRLRLLDAHRVLAAPRGLPLRARGRHRRAAPLHHPRRPPRPPERPDAPGHAALGQRAAGAALLRPVRAGARHPRRAPVRGRLPLGLPDLRHDALPRASPQAAHAPGPPAARAAHAPPLPGRHEGLRRERPVLGLRLPHAQRRGSGASGLAR